jgi:hypothetical protein
VTFRLSAPSSAPPLPSSSPSPTAPRSPDLLKRQARKHFQRFYPAPSSRRGSACRACRPPPPRHRRRGRASRRRLRRPRCRRGGSNRQARPSVRRERVTSGKLLPCGESDSASLLHSCSTIEGGPPGQPGIASRRLRGTRPVSLKVEALPSASSPANRMGGRGEVPGRPRRSLVLLGAVGGFSLAGHAQGALSSRRFPAGSGPIPAKSFPSFFLTS